MKKFYALVLFACAMALTACNCSDKQCPDKLNVIFETDIGNDIDDALALDMLYKYHQMGKINFAAVMLNKCDPAPAEYMDISNTWYGYTDMPVALSGTEQMTREDCMQRGLSSSSMKTDLLFSRELMEIMTNFLMLISFTESFSLRCLTIPW